MEWQKESKTVSWKDGMADQKPQKTASDQGQYCLPLIQQFLDTSTGSKMPLFKF